MMNRDEDWNAAAAAPAANERQTDNKEQGQRSEGSNYQQQQEGREQRDFRDKPRGDFRNDRNDRNDRPRRDFGDRNDRPRRFDSDRPRRDFGDRNDRPSFGDRNERSDRPRRDFGDRNDRPAFGDRNDRPRRDFGDRNDRPRRDFGDRNERPSFGDRNDRPRRDFGDRNDRPRRDFGDRNERPSFGDRNDRPRRDFGDRNDRPRRDFGDRNERPAFGDRNDRPRRDFGDRNDRPRRDFGDRNERPRRDFGDRNDRPAFGDRNDRPRRDFGDRNERPAFGDRNDRPRRDFGDRNDRPRRDFGDRNERPAFGDRNDRPRRDFGDRNDRPRRDFGDRNDRPRRDWQDRDSRFKDNTAPQGEDAALNLAVQAGVVANQDQAGGQEQAAPEQGFVRPERPRREARSEQRQKELGTIRAIDEDILRMIMRRASILQRLNSKGRLRPEFEKNLRLSWEQKAAFLSRDNRLIREMFTLLQGVEPLSRFEEEQPFYNLAPLRRPAEIDLPASADPLITRCWLALSGASGQIMELSRVALTSGCVSAIKSLNQIGADLRWEDGNLVMNRGGGLPHSVDKAVHVGDDEFSLFMILCLCLGRQSRLKISGGQELRLLNLMDLRRFLPQLGARLSNVIPGQDGLPIRVECSGVLPEEIELTDDLPEGFALALCLALPFLGELRRVILPPALAPGHPGLASVAAVMREAGLEVSHTEEGFKLEGGTLLIPANPACPADMVLALGLLLIPALSQGECRLHCPAPQPGTRRELMEKILACTGLSYSLGEEELYSQMPEGAQIQAPDSQLLTDLATQAPDLLPSALLLCAAAVRAGQSASLPPELLTGTFASTIEGFLAQVGLEAEPEGQIIFQSEENQNFQPWFSPDPVWGLAFTLAAYLRPNLRLINLSIMEKRFPNYWTFYNSLPRPSLERKQQEEVDEQPSRRRIIAAGVFGELPPDPPAAEED